MAARTDTKALDPGRAWRVIDRLSTPAGKQALRQRVLQFRNQRIIGDIDLLNLDCDAQIRVIEANDMEVKKTGPLHMRFYHGDSRGTIMFISHHQATTYFSSQISAMAAFLDIIQLKIDICVLVLENPRVLGDEEAFRKIIHGKEKLNDQGMGTIFANAPDKPLDRESLVEWMEESLMYMELASEMANSRIMQAWQNLGELMGPMALLDGLKAQPTQREAKP